MTVEFQVKCNFCEKRATLVFEASNDGRSAQYFYTCPEHQELTLGMVQDAKCLKYVDYDASESTEFRPWPRK